MGACVSARNDQASLKSKHIESELKKYHEQYHNRIKLLLLGPGESGKSTVFKQMKIIQDGGGFNHEELVLFRSVIFSNCVSQMRELVQSAAILQMPFTTEAAFKTAQSFLALPAHVWSTEVGDMLKEIWSDRGIKEVYKLRGKKFQLNESAQYFFDNLDRIKKESYVPTVEDVLRARVRTTGIEEAEFSFDQLIYTVVDVGGQRSERRKWIHCFDSVTAVIFCASLSGYDEKLREDSSQVRIAEDLLLFKEISNSSWFRKNSIILFLNKMDLFREKIKTSPLTSYFQDYKGPIDDLEAAKEFIKDRFIEQAKEQTIYTHFTCALDTKNITFVINSVRETLLNEILGEIGFNI